MANYLITIFNQNLNQKVEYFYNLGKGVIEAKTIWKGENKIILERENKAESFLPEEKKLFEFILERRKNISGDDAMALFDKQIPDKIAQVLGKIVAKIKKINNDELIEFNQSLTTKFLFNYSKKNLMSGLLSFQHQYQVIGHLEKNEMFKKNQISESSVTNTELMQVLLKKSNLLHEILYQTTTGDFLPFIQMSQSIRFPLIIDNEKTSVQHKWADSYKAQREGLGARMYDGSNLRAIRIQDHQLIVGKSSYFAILDSADYVASRLKVYHHQQNIHEFERIFKIWSERLNSLEKEGLFNDYNSGVAFSMPIFQICDNGDLKVLAAKGSQFKANGSGKRHIAPAGMLEFFTYDQSDKFDFEDFKTLCAKELLEETVFGQETLKLEENNPFFSILFPFFETLNLRRQDDITLFALMSFIKVIHDNWEEIWSSLNYQDSIPNKAALSYLLKMNEDVFCQTSYFVLDFANLRPEFIVPIYISEQLNEIVNWEYEKENAYDAVKKDILTFNNLDDLNTWAKNEVNDYCAPALAAIYLGAKQFFMNPAKFKY